MASGDGPGVHVRSLTAARALLLLASCSGLVAWAQSIKMPDFRLEPRIVTVRPGEPCNGCGRIVSVREIYGDRRPDVPAGLQASPGSSSGVAGRNLVGAVIYLPLGGETAERPFVGGAGTPEARERFRQSNYEITVRFDDGTVRSIQRHDGTRYRTGDRVRVTSSDQIDLIAE